jgi:hypothetical protein
MRHRYSFEMTPMNAQESRAFFVGGVILAGVAARSYYVAAGKLIKVGIKVKFLAMPSDMIRTLRVYCDAASFVVFAKGAGVLF